jgi:hypothetical protein
MLNKVNVVLSLTGFISIVASSTSFADDDQGVAVRSCLMAGAYIGVIPGATTFIMSNVPLDHSANKVLVTVDTTGDADPTSRGLFPSAVGQSHPTGFAIKEAPNEYAGQLVRYRFDRNGKVVSTEIQITHVTQMSCNSIEVAFVAQWFYFGFVNPGDGTLPAPDIVVDVSKVPAFTAKLMLPLQP